MNFRTMDDIKKANKDQNRPKKETSSYTGGESSGMAVINPDVKNILEKAEKNSKSRDQLEQEDDDAIVCEITIYQNGFIVGDGQFQDGEKPESKQFLKQLSKGLIPKSLREKYPRGGVTMRIADKTSQKYKPPPPPPYTAFSGTAISLSEEKQQQSKFNKKSKPLSNYILQPDRKRQVTTIRVRLLNGTTITIEANLDTPLQNIHDHVETVSGTSNFTLIGGYPPKPLVMSSNVQDSDLADSTLIQK